MWARHLPGTGDSGETGALRTGRSHGAVGLGVGIVDMSPIRDIGPRCEAAGDLLQRPACRVIGTLLRSLLDELCASPLELLTDDAWSPRLQPHEALIAAAVRKVASMQGGGAPDGRAAMLERLVGDTRRRARAVATRMLCPPGLDAGGLDVLLARVRALGGADGAFLALRAVARHLVGAETALAKIDMLLDLMVPALSLAGRALVDRYLAGLVDGSATAEALVGDQADFGDTLLALSRLAIGVPADDGGDRARRLAVPLSAGLLPDTGDALWDRITAGLLSHRPLAPGGQAAWSQLQCLDRALQLTAPDNRRPRLAAAVAARRLALRRAADRS
ncbi:MAG TPA: hypothetical protein VGV37_07840 [Aliidongia sp.]|uniref:hypothetical protein n=1 Tax=Aliidongia sp. TaxID=1914230 RepID=UPI002DDD6F07|nr:hypothetical protein [Aliidongia sp.]HEV2674437.1 hypothetical protein [Aliidongia sp.]